MGDQWRVLLFVGERMGKRLHTRLSSSLNLQEKKGDEDVVRKAEIEADSWRNSQKSFFNCEGVSIYRRETPNVESRHSAFESYSRGHLRADCIDFPAVTPKQKKKIK